MEWILSNLATISVGLLVFGAVAAVLVVALVKRKKGVHSCACGCNGCANAPYCHEAKK